MHWLAQLPDWFDTWGQWIAIKGIYAHEVLVLPVAAVLLVLWPRSRAWRCATFPLGAAVLVYLLYYQMHWCSFLAWPLMAGTGAYFLSRIHWSQAVSCRPRPGQWWQGVRRFAWSGKRPWLRVALILAGTLGVFLLRVPIQSLLVLAGVLLAGALLAWLLGWMRGGERGLLAYIDQDPRLELYLDCVRRIQARWHDSTRSLLAGNRVTRLVSPLAQADASILSPGCRFWPLVFRAACAPGMRHMLRFLSHRHRLGTLGSRYITERVAWVRERTWSEYESARFGRSLDDYLARVQHADATEPDTDKARPLRLKWLALTEALAECNAFFDPGHGSHGRRGFWARLRTWGPIRGLAWLKNLVLHRLPWFKFGDPPGAANMAKTVPDLHLAAGLLSHAAEVQHEVAGDLAFIEAHGERIVSDLKQTGRDTQDAKAKLKRAQTELAGELRLAIHFFDLSARCLELYLLGEVPDEAAPELVTATSDGGIPQRARYFCEKLTDEDWWRNHTGPTADATQVHLRLALSWQYLLLARLRDRCERLETMADDGRTLAELSADERDSAPKRWLKETGQRLTGQIREQVSAHGFVGSGEPALIEAMAQASLSLDVDRGDQARVMLGHLAYLQNRTQSSAPSADKLACAEELLVRVKDRVDSRRLSMLWGRAIEEELAHALPDAGIWLEHCRQAVGFYGRAKSRRVRRIYARALGLWRTDASLSAPDATSVTIPLPVTGSRWTTEIVELT